MTKQNLEPYKNLSRKQAVAVAAKKRTVGLHPFMSVKDATVEAIEYAIKATDNANKRRAWRKLHAMITGKPHDWFGDS